MPESILRKVMLVLAIMPFVTSGMGCDSTEVELKKEPLVEIPEAKDPKELPKHLRPARGSSAGMNRDPSGVVQP